MDVLTDYFNRFTHMSPAHGVYETQVLLMCTDSPGKVVETVGLSLKDDSLKDLDQVFFNCFVTGDLGYLKVDVSVVDQPFPGKSPLGIVAIEVNFLPQPLQALVTDFQDCLFDAKDFQAFP